MDQPTAEKALRQLEPHEPTGIHQMIGEDDMVAIHPPRSTNR
jgi:hypothetical protein